MNGENIKTLYHHLNRSCTVVAGAYPFQCQQLSFPGGLSLVSYTGRNTVRNSGVMALSRSQRRLEGYTKVLKSFRTRLAKTQWSQEWPGMGREEAFLGLGGPRIGRGSREGFERF